MIEGFAGSVLIGYISPVALFTAAVCMLVLRAGASRVFFDIVGTFQASKLISDAKSAGTVFEAIYLDALTGVQEAGAELAEVFNNVTDSVVPIARELAEAEIQLEKFLDTGEDIRKIRKEVEGIGLEFGFAGDSAMEAAAKMAQISGVLGPGTLGVGTEIGIQFGLISGMETEAAMQRMINLQQQTKFMTEGIDDNASATERQTKIRKNSMIVLDQLNTIENRSAATMEQITFVMNQFASQAHLANEEIKSMAALSAVMIETGEEQGKGGRALKMMYARLGSDIGGARTEMERLGVEVIDQEGNMRALSDMLMDLEDTFNGLDGAQQQNTAQVVAGNRHYTRFLKLMTNLDRVKELELEATMALFPAMDEINRRRESELFQLQQSEANVKNLSAALGNQLLPAMTEISDKQAMFLQTIVALNEGPLGRIITGMMALTKSASVLIGPIVNTIINFKNMSIAFQTHSAITRALNQQQEMVNAGFMMGGAAASEFAKHVGLAEMIASRLKTTHDQLNDAIELNVHLMKMSADELADQALEMDKAADASNRAGDAERFRAAAEERRRHAAAKYAVEAKEHGEQQAADIEMAKQQAQAFNGITMAMVSTGSALMMFGKSQRIVRTGMVLNTAAMGAQIIAMIHKNREQTKDLMITMGTAIQTAAQGAAARMAAIANKKLTLSLTGVSAAMKGVHASMVGIVKVSGPFIALFAASYGITYLLEKVGVFADDAAESVTDFNTAMADTGVVLDMLADEEFGIEKINEQLKIKEGLLGNVANSTSELGKITEQSLRQEIANLRLAKDIRELGDIELAKDKAQEIFDLGEMMKTHDDLTLEQRLQRIATGDFNAEKEAKEHNKRVKEATDKLKEEYPVLFSFIKQHEIKNMTDLEGVIDQFYSDIESRARDNVNSIVNDVGMGVDALHQFTNAREEMFHGFRADNLTGDLIRQVQQQGVENLITNTEVVMTNVFNGVTIPEMADIIIEEIEFRGRANGFNVTANAA